MVVTEPWQGSSVRFPNLLFPFALAFVVDAGLCADERVRADEHADV